MASLALGTAGAIIGGYFGGPIGANIGFAVGSALGSLLDPPKVEGPRRTDLKLQMSTYGAPIPYLYGTVRAAGNVIDQSSELTETKHTSGGKGGPKQTTYTYSVGYVAILLCAAPSFGVPAIKGIRRIWADNRLFSEDGESRDDFQFVVYTGTETQSPDPTLEAEHGVGNVPAYLGYAYVVIRDWTLTDFGDRVPSLEWEIEATGDTSFTRISTFSPTAGGNSSFTGIGALPVDGAYLDGSQIVVCHYEEGASTTSTYQEFRYNLHSGALVDTGPVIVVPNVADSSFATYRPSTNSNIALGIQRGAGIVNVSRWYVRGVRGSDEVFPPVGTDAFKVCGSRPFLYEGVVYSAGDGNATTALYVGKWTMPDAQTVSGTPEPEYFDIEANLSFSAAGINSGTISLTFDDEGSLYVYVPQTGTVGNLFKVDPATMTLVKRWITGSPITGRLNSGSNLSTFTVYRGLLCVLDSGGSEVELWEIPDVVTDPFVQVSGEVIAVSYFGSGFSPTLTLGNGYVLGYDGVYYIGTGETLGNIVASVSELAGLDASEYDVTDLTDPVPGYRIPSQMTARNAIEPLRLGYFFDGAEVDGAMLFKHRDGTSVATIDEADLAAHEAGTDAPATITVTRIPDHELPRRVFVKYINPDQSYETGTQYDERQTGESQAETSMDLPIVLDDDSAKAIASAHVFVALLERERFTIYTTRKWEMLVPTDVIEVLGRTLRIVDKRARSNGIVEFDLLTASAAPFIQPSGTSGASVYVPPNAPGARAITQAKFLDIPNIYQTDPPFGFRVAMAPDGAGAWTGAALFKSYDNTNYVQVASSGTPDVIGYTSAIGSPAVSAVAAVGVTLGIVLTTPDGELESYTASDLLGGLGLFAVQRSDGFWNLFQYQTATLVSADPPTYELSGIIEAGINDRAITGHASGDAFVLLPAVTVDAPESDLNIPIYYKAVTFGLSLSSTPYTIFTNTGVATETYYQTTTNHLAEFSCEFGSPIGSPAVGRQGVVPAPTLDDCNNERILSVHGWIDQPSGGGGSPAGGSSLTVYDESVLVDSAVTSLNFTGFGVDAISLGAGSIGVSIVGKIITKDDGALVLSDSVTLDFQSGLRATDAGLKVTRVDAVITAPVYTAGGGANDSLPNARSLSATTPVRFTDSGGSPPSDTAISVDVMGGADTGSPSPHAGTSGLVPAPSSGDGTANKVLCADGTWKTVASIAPSGDAFAYHFGDGSDGDVTFDGSSAVTGWTRSGSTYTFNAGAIPQYNNVTIDSGVTVNPTHCPLYVNGTLTLNGTIVGQNHSTKNASAGTQGFGALPSGSTPFYGGSTSGGNGTTGGGQAGGASGTGCIGGAGGAAGSNGGGAGANGGTVTIPTNAAGGLAYAWSYNAISSALTRTPSAPNQYLYGTGGGGGRGNGASVGGGGGGGGAVVGLMARYITGTGSCDVSGGNGAQGTASGCSGGGGGGGGVVWVLTSTAYASWTFTTNVAGGTKGAANGAGNAGVDGNPGRVIYMIISS